MTAPISFWLKVWSWIKEKWELVVGIVIALIAIITSFIRGKQQKKVLEAANKAHEKEIKINDKAREDLVDGLTDISKEKDKSINEVNREINDAERKLAKEKEDFVDDAAKSDDLARKIADHLDAEFVDANDNE